MNKKILLHTILLICISFILGCGKSPIKPAPAEPPSALKEIEKRSGIKFSKDFVPVHYVTWNNRHGYEVWMSFHVTKSQKDAFLPPFHVKPAQPTSSLLTDQSRIPETEAWKQISPWWDVKSLSDAEEGTLIGDSGNISLYMIAGNTSQHEAVIYLYAFLPQ